MSGPQKQEATVRPLRRFGSRCLLRNEHIKGIVLCPYTRLRSDNWETEFGRGKTQA